ncbi:MAG: mechanosensitive ion channel [SAR324 cluster bacterium]|nr:mechanosensitive ion channel [SAR324 cluster bacterium]
MKLKSSIIISFLILLVLTVVGGTYFLNPNIADNLFSVQDEAPPKEIMPLHFAVAGPMQGDKAAGQTFMKAAQIFVDDFNLTSAESGLQITLHPFDDKNNSKEVKPIAESIANDPNIIGVIGHNFSSVSLAAGAVYKKAEIPAITPTSTNTEVTRDNPWSFRTVFDDAYQGKFIAQYAKSMLNKESVAVYYEDKPYGEFLGEKFLEQARLLGMEIVASKQYSTDPVEFQKNLATVSEDLSALSKVGLLFIPGHNLEVTQIIRRLKDEGFEGDIILPDAMAQQSFVKSFQDLPKENQHPGYYSDGVFVAAPLLYDGASRMAQDFAAQYKMKYGEKPDWRAAYAYDAILMFANAAKLAKLATNKDDIKKKRVILRDQLAIFNQMNQAFRGVTGLNYFNDNRSMEKPLSIGQYRQNTLVSAPLQMNTAGDPRRISGLDERLKEGLMINVNDNLYHRTYIVYTGVEVTKISGMKHEDMTYDLEFDLWFRYQRGIDVRDIEFCNSAAPIKLRMPKEEVAYGNLMYRKYEVKGKFKADFTELLSPDLHNIGICFAHRDLSRSNLIFVPDIVGGNLESYVPDRNARIEMKRITGWSPIEHWSSQTVFEKPIQGNLKYIHETSKKVPFSSFYSAYTLEADTSLIRGAITPDVALVLIPLSLLFLFALENRYALQFWLFPTMNRLKKKQWEKQQNTKKTKPKKEFFYNYKYEEEAEVETFEPGIWSFITKSLTLIFLLYNAEVVVSDYYFQIAEVELYQLANHIFDIMWWFVPTLIFVRSVNKFFWKKIETESGRHIPKFAKGFFSTTVFALMLFGILAFVYDQTAASILGTSGIFVMIIGMAIQMNISNMFAGLVLNIEKSIRMGDWVQIGEIEEGKVVEINWRTVRIRTRDGSLINIPNNTISESNFQNFSHPNPIIEEIFEVNLFKSEDYKTVFKILMKAMTSCESVLEDPAPIVRFDDYTWWSARYLCVYNIGDYGVRRQALADVWEKVIQGLKKAGIDTASFKDEPDFKTSENMVKRSTFEKKDCNDL